MEIASLLSVLRTMAGNLHCEEHRIQSDLKDKSGRYFSVDDMKNSFCKVQLIRAST